MATAEKYPPWPPFVTVRQEDKAGELTRAVWHACCLSDVPETMTKEFWVGNDWVRAPLH